MSDWNEDQMWSDLTSELEDPVRTSEADMAQRMFREHVVQATASIISLAVNAMNERTKLDAAKYVVERVLGKVLDTPLGSKGGWEELLAGTVVDAEQFANSHNPNDTDNDSPTSED